MSRLFSDLVELAIEQTPNRGMLAALNSLVAGGNHQ